MAQTKLRLIIMFKKNILITGGAGFVGTNLIKLILEKTNYRVISLDDYSSGSKKNHLKDRRVKYINAHTKNISQTIENPKLIQLACGRKLYLEQHIVLILC